MTNSGTPMPELAAEPALSSLDQRDYGVTQTRVFRSEWIKLKSLRSTTITLIVATVLFIGIGLIGSFFISNRWNHLSVADRLRFDPINVSLNGVFLAQLAIGVLGVLVITNEYSSGMVRASFAAVPRRLPVLWAKIVVFGVVSFVLMLIAGFIAFFACQAVLTTGPHDLSTTIGHAGAVRAIFGAAGYLTLIGIGGITLGVLTRSTAGAISLLTGLLFVLPLLADILPSSWNDTINPYFPAKLGAALFRIHPDNALHAGSALAVLVGYIVILIIASAFYLRKRDA